MYVCMYVCTSSLVTSPASYLSASSCLHSTLIEETSRSMMILSVFMGIVGANYLMVSRDAEPLSQPRSDALVLDTRMRMCVHAFVHDHTVTQALRVEC
jgi:hypothetical protein